MSDVDARIEILSSRHAKVVVERSSPSPITLVRESREQHLALVLGVQARARYVLERASHFDEEWSLERREDASMCTTGWEMSWEFAEPLLDWCEGTAAQRGFEVLGQLPAGTYYVVRSAVTLDSKHLVLGNNAVPCPIDMRRLALPDRLFGTIVGARSGVTPAMDHPLIGIATANCGEVVEGVDGVLFFEALPGSRTNSTKDLDPVLVVPVTGDLVVDTETAYGASPQVTAATLSAWEERGAERYAVACAGESGDRIGRARGRR